MAPLKFHRLSNKAEVSELLHVDFYCTVVSGVEVSFSGQDVK